MAISHAIGYSFSNGSTALTATVTKTVEEEINAEATVPGSGNVVVSIAVDVSQLADVFISCDGTITLTTNDDGTPDDTFTITANEPLVWTSACGLPNPFASNTDITSIKAAKATAGSATLKMRFGLSDVTT